MNILVVLAHPSPRSFNHAIAQRVSAALKRQRHNVLFHDLYAEKFNPALQPDDLVKDRVVDAKIRVYCNELREADGLVFVHPNWWGGPPAMLKGWLDRVLRPNVAYAVEPNDSGEGISRGLLAGKKALVFNTSDTPPKREKESFGDPLEVVWSRCVFEFCGIREHARKTFGAVVTSTFEERQAWLAEAEAMAVRWFC